LLCKLPLEQKRRDKILEIGTTIGYQAATLAAMGAKFIPLNASGTLPESPTALISLGYTAYFFLETGTSQPQASDNGGIVITAAAPTVPESLLQQLKTGRAFVPLALQILR
jgi:protein-L-isoaspartate(D-aspartate) O-methyltransferase